MLLWAAALLAVSAAPEDKPFVEIVADTGSVDGAGSAATARWERVRLDLDVENRLTADVSDLLVEVQLVRPQGTPIAGWSFVETLGDTVAAGDKATLRIERKLAARRTSPKADEIAYRVHILGYRMSRPELDLALRLLGSGRPSDQRAALMSFERGRLAPETAAVVADELDLAIRSLPREPSTPDALRLLLAVHALGSLGAAVHVPALLATAERLDPESWGRAVLDLASRMLEVSAKDEPRLEVLPRWARATTDLVAVRAQDALFDALEDAVLRMGPRAVPALIRLRGEDAPAKLRTRALRLLHALGRSTPRSQLNLPTTALRIEALQALGQTGELESIAAIAELLATKNLEVRAAAQEALTRIGEPAIKPLAQMLGRGDDRGVRDALVALGLKYPGSLLPTAKEYGVLSKPNDPIEKVVDALAGHLAAKQRLRSQAQLQKALAMAKEGQHARALEELDQIYADDPELYRESAEAIAHVYLARAEGLYGRGEFDAAVGIMKVGLTVTDLEAGRRLVALGQLELARGEIALGELDKAAALLAGIERSALTAELNRVGASLLEARARQAYALGEFAKTRQLVDRIKEQHPGYDGADDLERSLLLADNWAAALVSGLAGVGGLLVLLFMARRRWERARLRRLTEDLEPEKA